MNQQDYLRTLKQINAMHDLASLTTKAFYAYEACGDHELHDLLQDYIWDNLETLMVSNSLERIEQACKETQEILEDYKQEIRIILDEPEWEVKE